MIENTLWMTYFEYLPIELKQAEEEGKNVELYRKEIEEIIQTSGDMSFEEKVKKSLGNTGIELKKNQLKESSHIRNQMK